MFTSYAQNFEDVMLWRALKHVGTGAYVDVGAQHPVVDSVSLAFYERGWRGIHVEPSPVFAAQLRQSRPEEIVIEAAVGGVAGETGFFEFASSGFSTCDPLVAAAHAANGLQATSRTVAVVTLAQVLEACGERAIHWLKIDVEGWEAQVLRGWGNSPARPWIVVVESVNPLTHEDCAKQWEHGLLSLGYDAAYFDGLNRYYVAQGHPELKTAFAAGPNVFDNFALSGTASAPFCMLLSEQKNALSRMMEDQRLRLVEYGHNVRMAHDSDREAWAHEQAEAARYIASLKQWGGEVEAYAKTLEEERRRLEALIQSEQADFASRNAEAGRRIVWLEAQIALGRDDGRKSGT